jgi:hypothetical protein
MFSPWLYAVGFSVIASAIVTEQIERKRVKRLEAEKWQTAELDGKNSSSSPLPAQHSPSP